MKKQLIKTGAFLLGCSLTTLNGYGQWSVSGSTVYTTVSSDKVCVGTSTPSSKLEVSDGDLNIATSLYGLRMQSNTILSTDATQSSINLGLNAGSGFYAAQPFSNCIGISAGNSISTGQYNNFMGNSAGQLNTTGSNNEAIGNHASYSNVSGNYNSAFGDNVLYNNTASSNSAFGYQALKANTSGTPNNAFGYQALYSNNIGNNNNAFGYQTLNANTTGNQNTSMGDYALATNATGSYNAAFGYKTLQYSTNGYNTAFGYAALNNTTTGVDNTAVGLEAGYNNTGSNNVYMGYFAGTANTSGSNNTFLGNGTNVNSAGATLTYQSAIGSGAVDNQGGNTMMFGNSAAVGLYTPNGIFATSDGRFKTNVKEDVKGISFIKKLRPVTYNMDTKALDDFIIQDLPDSIKTIHKQGMDFSASTAIVHSGFIAQEVEQAQKDAGFTSSIVSHPATSGANYALNYAEIVVPLVKAVQEQQDMIDSLLQKVEKLSKLVTANGGATNATGSTTGINNNISTQLSDAIVLNQNAPNPFAEQTVITYNIPQNAGTSQILFYNLNGQLIKTIDISTKGQGALTVFANDLSNGTYSYSLLVDGKIMDTKKMIKQQ